MGSALAMAPMLPQQPAKEASAMPCHQHPQAMAAHAGVGKMKMPCCRGKCHCDLNCFSAVTPLAPLAMQAQVFQPAPAATALPVQALASTDPDRLFRPPASALRR